MASGLTPVFFLLSVSAVLSLIFSLAYCYRPASVAKSVVKTSSIGALVIASLFGVGSIWLTFALLFCALGDYLLALDEEKAFLGGVGAFALGHVFYINAFFGHPFADINLLYDAPRSVAVLALLGLAVIMGFVLFRRTGELRFAVLGYCVVIVGMGITALAIPAIGPLALVPVGALLFVLSDFTLSMEMFVLKEQSPFRRITPFVVWSTYWLAQVALLVGLGSPLV